MKLAVEGGKKLDFEFPLDKTMLSEETIQEVAKTLRKGYFTMFDNDLISLFEAKFADFNESKYAVAVSNGTSALTSALRSLDVGYGDEVILPSYSYAAVLMAVEETGAKPVFADIDFSVTLNPKDVGKKINKKTKAIIPVHMFGNPSDLDELKKFNIPLVEDCAHASGVRYKGKRLGKDLGCHSFGETKILRIGEGGMVTTDNEDVARKLKIIRHEGEIYKDHNMSTTEVIPSVNDLLDGISYEQGFNYRMMPLQASIGVKRLEVIENFIKKMNSNALYLIKNLNVNELVFQKDNDGGRVYNNVPCLVQSQDFSRNSLFISLAAQGIPVGVYFPHNFAKDCGRSQEFCDNHLVLPSYPNMDKEHLDVVIDEVKKVIEELKKKDIDIKSFMEKKVKHYSAIHVTI